MTLANYSLSTLLQPSQTSNEALIRQKYESMSHQPEFSEENLPQTQSIAAFETQLCNSNAMNNSHLFQNESFFDKYLNFGYPQDELLMNQFAHPFDTMNSNIVKQEELESDLLQYNQQPFLQFNENKGASFDFEQVNPIAPQINSVSSPSSFQSQNLIQPLPKTQVSEQMSIKMKRIMKREKAKSRRIQNLEQQQKQEQIINQQPAPSSIIEDLEISPQSLHQSQQAEFDVKMECLMNGNGDNSSSMLQTGATQNAPLRSRNGSSSMESVPPVREDAKLKALQLQCQSGTLDPKQQKKVMQMIRNRISAQNSRDRKKAYISKLEQDLNEGDDLRSSLHDTKLSLNLAKNKNIQLQLKIQELQEKLRQKNSNNNSSSDSSASSSSDESSTIVNRERSRKPLPLSYHVQNNYAAFNVALFAFLGVVMIFNTKPVQNQDPLIQQGSQMTKMLSDLKKEIPRDFDSLSSSSGSSTASGQFSSEKALSKEMPLSERTEFMEQEDSQDLSGQFEENEKSHRHFEAPMSPSQDISEPQEALKLSAIEEESSVKPGQWISLVARHPESSEKNLRVWAQIHSVEEVAQDN